MIESARARERERERKNGINHVVAHRREKKRGEEREDEAERAPAKDERERMSKRERH